MDQQPKLKTWWLGLSAAAVLLLGATALLVLRGAPPPAPEQAAKELPDAGASPAAAQACDAFDSSKLLVESDKGEAPVLLWAVGPVKLYVDDKPAFSPPEQPLRFIGEHVLRAEAEGQQPFVTRFRVDPHVPALFHVQVDDAMGITAIHLGAACASCELPSVDVALDFERSTETAFELLSTAADGLRRDKWPNALERLRRVPMKDRDKPVFHRLASSMYQDASRPEEARKQAELVPAARSNDLAMLLKELRRLEDEETKLRGRAVLARWNFVTDRFSVVASRFQEVAPGPIATSAQRLQGLTAELERAFDGNDPRGQRSALNAATETVRRTLDQLAAARPGDCALQAQLAKAVGP